MTWADEGKYQNGEPKKPELLPTGDEAKEIIEVLAAMYRATHNPEDVASEGMGVEGANQQKDAEYKKKGEEQTK